MASRQAIGRFTAPEARVCGADETLQACVDFGQGVLAVWTGVVGDRSSLKDGLDSDFSLVYPLIQFATSRRLGHKKAVNDLLDLPVRQRLALLFG